MIDYTQIAAIIARIFKANNPPEILGLDAKRMSFKLNFPDREGRQIEATIRFDKFTVEIIIPSNSFAAVTIEDFREKIEFEFEQIVFRNVKMTIDDEGSQYRVKISY